MSIRDLLANSGRYSTSDLDTSAVGPHRTPVPTNVRCDLCLRRPASYFDETTKANYCKECLELLLSLEPLELRQQHKLTAPRRSGCAAFAQNENVGIGVQLERDFADGSVRVKQMLPHSPAALCGEIQENDLLCQVDGIDVSSLSVEDLAVAIQGPSGSTVVLGIVRPGALNGLIFVKLTRSAAGVGKGSVAPYVAKRYDNVPYFLSPEERAQAQAEARQIVDQLRQRVFGEQNDVVSRHEPYVTTTVIHEPLPAATVGAPQTLGFIASEETIRNSARGTASVENNYPLYERSTVQEARIVPGSEQVTRVLPVMRDGGDAYIPYSQQQQQDQQQQQQQQQFQREQQEREQQQREQQQQQREQFQQQLLQQQREETRTVYSQPSENVPIGYERSMDSVDDPTREVLKA